MYQAHWGLRESPFRGLLDPKFFYQSPTHEEALARLQFLVHQQRRLGLLVGPPGSGKSLLLEVFAAQLRRNARPVAKLSLLGVEPAELLWLLAADWGLSLEPTQSLAALWRAVTDRLIEYRYQQLEAVVLLDDADQADRAGVAARDAVGPLRSFARGAADDRVGRPQRGDVEVGPAAVGSGRSADRPRALGAGRYGGLRDHAAWPKPGGSRRCLPSRPSPDCTSFRTASPAASPNWPIWRCWPGPERISSRSTPTWSTRSAKSWRRSSPSFGDRPVPAWRLTCV